MKTLLLDGASEIQIDNAAEMLKSGKLVAIPTETVYGLAADASNPDAVAAIFKAKGRPANHPLIVHIGDIEQLDRLAIQIPPVVQSLASHFWPGPLTLLLNKHPDVSDTVTGGLATIGVRMPDHQIVASMLAEHNLMVAAPSANPYKRLSPTSAEQVLSGLDGRIDAVLDGGPCEVGLESTILDLTEFNETGDLVIRRTGHITAEQISDAIGMAVQSWQPHDKAVPGNVSAHYQPSTTLRVLSADEISDKVALGLSAETGIISFSDALSNQLSSMVNVKNIKLPDDKPGYARMLYASLYQLDKSNASEIWLERPPGSDEWQDVNDRLSRATH